MTFISIHALAKRATRYRGEFRNWWAISIHALAKRATGEQRGLSLGLGHFNPRPRKEGDSQRVSTRTFTSNFNPRPRKEGDFMQTL